MYEKNKNVLINFAFRIKKIFHTIVTNKCHQLGDNRMQNFNLGRYIVGYTVGNLVLWPRASGAVKLDFQPYILPK